MSNKCDKYESYFIFANDDDFKHHLNECEDCQKEYEKQEKVSSLIKEVKDVYKKKSAAKLRATIAACFLMLSIVLGAIIPVSIDNYKLSQLKYSDHGYFYEIGMPTDDYGLIDI